MWKSWSMIAVLLVAAFIPADVLADDKEKQEREPLWSIGAGVNFGSVYSLTAYGGLAGLTAGCCYGGFGCWAPFPGTDAQPSGQLFVERRLSDSSAILMRLTATYANWDSVERDLSYTGNRIGVGAHLGYRYIFNPGAWTEFSAFVLVGGDWYWSELSPEGGLGEGDTYTDHVYVVGTSAGIALELELLRNLFLRLESLLVSFHYTRVEAKADLGDGAQMSRYGNQTGGGLTLNPSIQLRFAF